MSGLGPLVAESRDRESTFLNVDTDWTCSLGLRVEAARRSLTRPKPGVPRFAVEKGSKQNKIVGPIANRLRFRHTLNSMSSIFR